MKRSMALVRSLLLGLALILVAPVAVAGGSDGAPAGMLVMHRPAAGTWGGVVTQTFRRAVDHLLRVHLADGSRIDCTDEHPFYAVERGWTGSGSLRAGDRVLAGLASGSANDAVAVQRIERLPGGVVYNLEVATDHTYFVQGQGGAQVPVWVHNVCKFGTWMNLVNPPVQVLSRKLLESPPNPKVITGRPLTEAELHEAMQKFIKSAPSTHGPVYIIRETTSGGAKDAAKRAEQQALQDGMRAKFGSPIDEAVALRRQIDPGSRQHSLVIFDGHEPGTSKLYEAKNDWGPTHLEVVGDNGRPRKMYATLLRWAEALTQNPGHTLTVVVPDAKAAKMLRDFNLMKKRIQRAIDEGDLVGVDPKTMLALADIKLVSLGALE
jgi:hypothetical protein